MPFPAGFAPPGTLAPLAAPAAAAPPGLPKFLPAPLETKDDNRFASESEAPGLPLLLLLGLEEVPPPEERRALDA